MIEGGFAKEDFSIHDVPVHSDVWERLGQRVRSFEHPRKWFGPDHIAAVWPHRRVTDANRPGEWQEGPIAVVEVPFVVGPPVEVNLNAEDLAVETVAFEIRWDLAVLVLQQPLDDDSGWNVFVMPFAACSIEIALEPSFAGRADVPPVHLGAVLHDDGLAAGVAGLDNERFGEVLELYLIGIGRVGEHRDEDIFAQSRSDPFPHPVFVGMDNEFRFLVVELEVLELLVKGFGGLQIDWIALVPFEPVSAPILVGEKAVRNGFVSVPRESEGEFASRAASINSKQLFFHGLSLFERNGASASQLNRRVTSSPSFRQQVGAPGEVLESRQWNLLSVEGEVVAGGLIFPQSEVG